MKAIIATLALVCCSASAEFLTGNELLARLNSESHYDRGSANGYIMGVFDAQLGVMHCAPLQVTVGQVVDMTRSALQAAPSVRHRSADSFVVYALINAWPCPKKGTGT